MTGQQSEHQQQPRLERIILGDDELEFAKRAMPFIPNSEIEFVDSSTELMARVEENDSSRPYTMIISDYNYGFGLPTGLEVFGHMRNHCIGVSARKILWTGDAESSYVQQQASALGLELLDKPELGTIVGLSVSKAPLKQGGSVLIYQPGADQPIYKAMNQVMKMLFEPGKVTVGHDLKSELTSGKYGLVIDCTTMLHPESNGAVAHDMKYLDLKEVPRVVCLRDVTRPVATIAKHVLAHYKNQE